MFRVQFGSVKFMNRHRTKKNKCWLDHEFFLQCFLAWKWFHDMTIFDTCDFCARTANMPQDIESTRFGWPRGMEEIVG